MDSLAKWQQLRDKLHNLEPYAHRYPLREYMKFLLHKHGGKIRSKLIELDEWKTWKQQRTKMCPNFDQLVEVASIMFDEFDVEEYKQFFVRYRQDVLSKNLDEDTMHDRMRRLEKKIGKIESTVKTIKRWMQSAGMKPTSKIENKTG